MELRSPAFENGAPVPTKYTGDGDNVSPPLEWSGAPDATRSFVLIVEDPDAPTGTFRHWGVYDIAPERDRLPEATTSGAKTERLGMAWNDFGHPRYDGPLPPEGHGTHHYHFILAALDVPTLSLPRRPSVAVLWEAAQEHVIAQAELVGTYER